MTPLDKLKKAAETAIPNVEGYEDFVEHDVHIWIKGATSEAARDYWSSEVIELLDVDSVWVELFNDLDKWSRSTKSSKDTPIKINELKQKYTLKRK